MKSLKDFRNEHSLTELNVTPIVNRVGYLMRQKIDFDVYLPSYGLNLQRDLVWNDEQKRELILSMLIERHIPDISYLNIIDPSDKSKEIFQIIDGKQRLSAMFDFINDKFKIEIDGKEYLYSELDDDYKLILYNYNIRAKTAYEEVDKPITDDIKLKWFKLLNFAGTPVDQEHINKFVK